MDANAIAIGEFLKYNNQYVAPVYQRNYAWTAQKECLQFWQDLSSLFSKEKSKHFLGSVVVIKLEQSLGCSFVIDGQQRLTTIQLLMMAMRDYAKERKTEDSSGESAWTVNYDEITDEISDMLVTNDNEQKLRLSGVDQDVFSKLLSGVPVPEDSASDTYKEIEQSTNVLLNYKFFLKQLRKELYEYDKDKSHHETETEAEDFEKFSAIWENLNNGFEIAWITLGDMDNPQRVFESLNSTGLDLQAADLIRNYVLMCSDDDVFDQYWQPFERLFPVNDSTYLTDFFLNLIDIQQLLSGRDDKINKNNLYPAFKKYYKKDNTQDTLTLSAKSLWQYGSCYAHIMKMNGVKDDNPELGAVFADIRWLSHTPHNPCIAIVLYLYYCHLQDENSLTLDELIKACRQVVSYMVRSAVLSNGSSGSRGHASLRKALFTDLAKTTNLAKQFQINCNNALLNGIFPKDVQFEHALRTADIYNTNKSLKLSRFLLTRLADLGSLDDGDLNSMTIEHILPQNSNLNEVWQQELGANWSEIQERFLHRLGNLTLTFYNSELGDKPFAEKLNYYRDSNIPYLNESIVCNQQWTQVEIEDRNRLLAQKCLELWPMPELLRQDEIDKIGYYAKRGRVKKATLSDFCGSSPSLFNCLKYIDEQVRNVFNDLPRFNCDMRPEFHQIEYWAFPQWELVMLQSDEDSECIKLWLHCSYEELPSDIKASVENSNDWDSWHGDEVCMNFDANANERDLALAYIELNKILNIVKISRK